MELVPLVSVCMFRKSDGIGAVSFSLYVQKVRWNWYENENRAVTGVLRKKRKNPFLRIVLWHVLPATVCCKQMFSLRSAFVIEALDFLFLSFFSFFFLSSPLPSLCSVDSTV